MKKINRFTQNLGRHEVLLLASLLSLVTVYAYYFLLLPQSWSLVDHYAWAITWGGPDFKPIEEGIKFLQGIMETGRFRPLDIFYWVVRYRFLPITPKAFHIPQFILAGTTLIALGLLLKRFTTNRAQVWLGLLVAAGNLSMKDWIFYSSTAEPLGATFFMVSLALYAYDRRWLSVPFFIAALLSKETFFVLFAPLFVFEILGPNRRKSLTHYLPLGMALLSVASFVLFVRSLPLVYASSFSLANISFGRALTALIMPAVKSLAPVMLLVAFSRFRARQLSLTQGELRLVATGLTWILAYSLFLTAWGPFDSWYYLHIPIPFGWSLVLASLWMPKRSEDDSIHMALISLAFVFFLVVSINGSKNVWSAHEEAKQAATIACEESERDPSIRIYTNCNEGAVQLRNYLRLEKVCHTPPLFNYLGAGANIPENPGEQYVAVINKKCDPFDLSSTKVNFTLSLGHWTVLKKLKY